MGNACTHQENDRTTYMESKVDEQEIRIEEPLQKQRLHERENAYFRTRIRRMSIHQGVANVGGQSAPHAKESPETGCCSRTWSRCYIKSL